MIIKIIQVTLIIAITVLLSVIVYSIVDFTEPGDRFTKFQGQQLLKYIDGDKTINLDYLR